MSSEMANNENIMTTSTGNVSFEVLIEPAKPNAVASPRIIQSPTSRFSLEDIQAKMKSAEERRASVEAEKLEKTKALEAKITEVAQRKNELDEKFRRQSEQELQKKMESIQENRDRLLMQKIDKIKEHEKHVEEVRKAKENVAADTAAPVAE